MIRKSNLPLENIDGISRDAEAKNIKRGDLHLSSLLLLNVIPQQVWTANESGKIHYVNEMICADFGYPIAAILRAGWASFVHPEDLSSSTFKWKESLISKENYSTEFRLLFSDGNYYWHLARANYILQDDKQGVWVGTNTNINEHKQNESRKDEFISVASHELKTPLSSIKGYNQLMLRKASDPVIKGYLERTAAQLFRLEKLISDLLDVSKINAGKMHLNIEKFMFSTMLAEAVASMQEIYHTHKIIINDNTETVYNGDQFRIEQVIQNFVSNAVKYSPRADRVILSCNVEDGNIVLSVTDFGLGIKTEDLHKLFERYYRADNTKQKFDGLGLGLFISADIIKRHGGTFWIESKIGEGSVFSFKLPLSRELNTAPEVRTPSYYRDQYLNISCPIDSDIMYVEWTGYQDMQSVKHGGTLMIEYLGANKRSKVFNDNRLVPGTWSEASDWAASVWLPLMELAGLRFFAWVLSSSAFSQLSAKKSVDNEESSAQILFFDQAEQASAWLTASN